MTMKQLGAVAVVVVLFMTVCAGVGASLGWLNTPSKVAEAPDAEKAAAQATLLRVKQGCVTLHQRMLRKGDNCGRLVYNMYVAGK